MLVRTGGGAVVWRAWEASGPVVARRPAHARLAGLVDGYFGYERAGGGSVTQRVLPSGAVVVMVDFESADRRTVGPDGTRSPHCGMLSPSTGLLDRPVDAETIGAVFGAGIVLTPPGAFALLGMAMHEVTNTRIPLAQALGHTRSDHLSERLAGTPAWEARFAHLDSVLLSVLTGVRRPAAAGTAAVAWHRLRRTAGRVSVTTLADDLGLSRRRIEEVFHEQIGLPPKRAARILRFHHAVRMLARPQGLPLSDIALDCGYADHAHLSREVKAMSGLSPREIRTLIRPAALPSLGQNGGTAHSFKTRPHGSS
ncbi:MULTISPECIES: helix-turn-helix domain-containing protein [unclassified Streptomyces]|uniref:helix-turn-helix domain-containing protein n=1 Tax=unclassified Streptomyces TaxID=2593676 RepID=UPI0037FD8A70